MAVKCSALPENLLESEMFGHVKGSFTSAYADKPYDWPGNVRELENAVKYALTFMSESSITPDLLPPKILHGVRRRLAETARPTVGRS